MTEIPGGGKAVKIVARCVRETSFRKGGLGKLFLRKLHLNWDLKDLGDQGHVLCGDK